MNFETIKNLPILIACDDLPGGALRPWVRRLPLRFQGVLVTALRGCDTATKEDNSKRLVTMVRRACLNPADARESLAKGGFFGFDPERFEESLREFLHSLDQYPTHYVLHICHACEVIGYESPEYEGRMAAFFFEVYSAIVKKFHMNLETRGQMHERLKEDRIAKGTVERDF